MTIRALSDNNYPEKAETNCQAYS